MNHCLSSLPNKMDFEKSSIAFASLSNMENRIKQDSASTLDYIDNSFIVRAKLKAQGTMRGLELCCLQLCPCNRQLELFYFIFALDLVSLLLRRLQIRTAHSSLECRNWDIPKRVSHCSLQTWFNALTPGVSSCKMILYYVKVLRRLVLEKEVRQCFAGFCPSPKLSCNVFFDSDL